MFKKVWSIVSIVFVSITVVLAILLAGVRIFGIKLFAVTSGSMAPAYPVGALLYVRPVHPGEVRVGDAITFFLDNGSAVATHRVIAVDTQGRYFKTKGDANEAPDGMPVDFERLIGVPILSIPLLGYFSSYVTSPPGLYIAVIAAFVILLLAFLPGLLKKAAGQDKPYEKSKVGMTGTARTSDRLPGKQSVKP
jgi:signal peptidase